VVSGSFSSSLLLAAIGLAIRNSPERVARRQPVRSQELSLCALRARRNVGSASSKRRSASGLPSSPEARSTPCRCESGDRRRRVGGDRADYHGHLRCQFGPSRFDPSPLRMEPGATPSRVEAAARGGDIPGTTVQPRCSAPRPLTSRHTRASTLSIFIVDGQDIPVISTEPGRQGPAPRCCTAHDLQQSDEIVVGPLTLASLHQQGSHGCGLIPGRPH